jgi:hypothetical protein
MKRSIREAFEAAQAVFEGAGYQCRLINPTGKGHAMCIATGGALGTIRIPLSGSPRGGVETGANMAASSARRRLRQRAAAQLRPPPHRENP